MNSSIYEMVELDGGSELISDSLLVLVIDGEERSNYALNRFLSNSYVGMGAIVFTYDVSEKTLESVERVKEIVESDDIHVIHGFPNSQYDFISHLRECESLIEARKIVIDISCILTPYLFLLFKCLSMWNKEAEVYAINTIPFDYSYSKSPFTSYRSYYGDLKMEEVFGFSGANGIHKDGDLFIFAGFEGDLALKVIEDIDYKQVFLVNALPSYYQKYKDISIINNYQLIVSHHSCKRLFAPAINPFETYNLLDKYIERDIGVSIAPLCTKPIALGICMYALDHDNVRIVYPFSDKYESDRSHDVYKSYVYRVR